jgi:hypothetical protein
VAPVAIALTEEILIIPVISKPRLKMQKRPKVIKEPLEEAPTPKE